MGIKEIRKESRLSRAAFSKKYDIPVRTLEDWEAGKRTPPPYVVSLLERAVKSDILADTSESDPPACI